MEGEAAKSERSIALLPIEAKIEEVQSVNKNIKHIELGDLVKIYGNKQWHLTNRDVRPVVLAEPLVTSEGDPINFPPIEGLESAVEFLTSRYLDYVRLLKAMDDSMSQLIHPQKKILFKRFIAAVVGRIVEIKCEMNRLTSTYVHNLIGAACDHDMTPADMVWAIPASMLEQQRKTFETREQVLTKMLGAIETSRSVHSVSTLLTTISQYKVDDTKDRKYVYKPTHSVSSNAAPKASLLSNSHKPKDVDEQQKTSKLNKISQSQESITTNSSKKTLDAVDLDQHMHRVAMDPHLMSCLSRLQCAWRKWLTRRYLKRFKQNVDPWLGMELKRKRSEKGETPKDSLAELIKSREDEFNACVEKERSVYMQGSEVNFDKWNLHYNLTQWVLEMRDLLGKRPLYPEPDIGGCTALYTNKTVEQVQEELEELELDAPKKKTNKDGEKDGKEKKKHKDAKDAKGKAKKEKNEWFTWTMPRSVAVPGLLEALEKYTRYWNNRAEEENIQQEFNYQLVREQLREEADGTIRQMVDKLMVDELERLRRIDRDKPFKPDKKKKDKKEKKGKKGKDHLVGKTLEQLYAELVLCGIIVRPQKVSLDDYVGETNICDTPSRLTFRLAGASDLKMVLRENFGVPLISADVHSALPLRNSLLLAGPCGVGKSLLVHGLAKETGANLIDISPAKMVGLYPSKSEENYLMNLLLKVSKEMEPTIILVDECHLLYPTKKSRPRPAITHDKPGRWGKMLTKLMKKLKQGDRVLLVGVTSEPFFAKQGPMFKLFQTPVLVPFPDYGSMVVLWETFINKLELPRPHNLDMSILAKLTQGFTGGNIQDVIKTAVTSERQASKMPLRNQEFLPAIVKHTPYETPNLEAWITWYQTTPLIKSREVVLQGIVEEEEAKEKEAEKSKKK